MFDFNMLSSLGCKLSYVNNKPTISVVNSRLLPKIYFLKNQEVIRVYYPGPSNFGQQSFDIEPNSFFIAYNASKHKRQQISEHGNAYSLSELLLPNDKRAFPKFILDFFNISPTLIRKLLHQRNYSKIALKPNQIAILSAIGQGWNRHRDPNAPPVNPNHIINQEEIQRCINNMNVFVIKAAQQHSYQFVFQYIEAYKELLSEQRGYSVNFIPKSKRDKLENEFIKKVNALQKE